MPYNYDSRLCKARQGKTPELSSTENPKRQNLANDNTSVYQTLWQQAGPGSHSIIYLPLWTATVTRERQQEDN
jgi:hypothetical protein